MNFFDTSALESALRRILLDGGVSEVVYANRPKSAPTRENRFAVVSVAGNLDDMACYGECVVRITLYARDAAGLKNSKALSEMQKALPPSLIRLRRGRQDRRLIPFRRHADRGRGFRGRLRLSCADTDFKDNHKSNLIWQQHLLKRCSPT